MLVKAEKEDELGDYEDMDSREEEHELILHVMRGMTELHTLKIRESIIGLLVLALIDSGASYNFLLKDVTNKLAMNGDRRNLVWGCFR